MKAANSFNLKLIIVIKNEAGPDAKAPAVYLNGRLISVIGGLRKGKITFKDIAEELARIRSEGSSSDSADRGGCSF